MATRALSLAVVLAVLTFLTPSVAAYPTATWSGTTDTLLCVRGACNILAPPVDDARVDVGTSTAKELRLTLEGPKGSSLALFYEVGGRTVMTAGKASQTTPWLPAPSDRVFEVSVADLSAIPDTGLRAGVPFELTAEYR